MNERWQLYAGKFNALNTRERVIVSVSVIAVILFVWWSYFAQPLLNESRSLAEQVLQLDREVESNRVAMAAIEKRLQEGVHKTQQEILRIRQAELQRVNALLQEKTLEFVDPVEMFSLMREMLFADSRLKLTGLDRKRVQPIFNEAEKDPEQPKIYRHVMQVSFEGSYLDILNYVKQLEAVEWKLIWDSIQLNTVEYPVIQVSMEISTLSASERWVGL